LGKASAPLYVAIVKTLMQRIADGVYPVGGLIPTEHELSDELAVSRQTVREAIRRLSEQGLVSRQPGVGTRVLRQTAESHYSHHMESLSELINYAFEAPLKLEQVDLISANRDQAKFLGCRVRTPWLWARGHRRRPDDSELLTASDVFVRPHYPGLEDRLLSAAGPVYDLLEREYGEVISAVHQEIVAVPIEGDTAMKLGVPPGTAGLEIRRRFIGNGDRLVMVGRSLAPGSRFSYVTTFRREAA
jgi:Transcriptional regulators